MSTLKFANPWSHVEGFTDLGSCTVNGRNYELYCFPGNDDIELMHIGARYGEDGDYISASIVATKLFGKQSQRQCYGYVGPIVLAVERMVERKLVTGPLHDVEGNVIVKK